ncbi:bifunctional oligoribonuclease/PAP phosphatase NrnA [Chitinophagales bacterium]|nr:bifunctional oligoribonuclease/PAP phosphatase NrnA [Chitinophagales bacterium]
MNWTITDLTKFLSEKRRILVTAHNKPDGDAIGSSLGIAHWLKSRGHEVQVMMPSAYPEFLHFLPGHQDVTIFSEDIPERVKEIAAAEFIVVLDLNTLGRTANMAPYLRQSTAPKMMIDHHLDPDHFAAFEMSETSASSTCELIYDFLEQMEALDEISPEMANCLLTGITTDTGRFAHATSARVHEVTADLIRKGAEPNKINGHIFNSSSLDRLKFLGFALGQRMKILPEVSTSIIAISPDDFQKFNFRSGDTEGLVNMPLSVRELLISILITQQDDLVKLSFRSKGTFPVNEIANTYFSGGGHRNAAGGRSHRTIEQVIKKLQEILPSYEKQIAEELKALAQV